MIGQVVEVAQDGRYLSVHRGFLVVQEGEKELGRVPLDDIAALIGNAHGLVYSNNLLVELAKRNAAFVLCGSNHNPVGILWSVDGHYRQGGRMDAQLEANRSTRKRLWGEIVRAKLAQQASVLAALGKPDAPVRSLIRRVRSGDPENIEAQAARRYWPFLFGDAFRRDRDEEGVNSLLNYGYTILRAATARSVMAAGLHPTIGIHHRNTQNAMRLVDDLMEPFRPLIDYRVSKLLHHGIDELNPETKRALVHVLYADLPTNVGLTPVINCVQRLATSLGQVYERKCDRLDLPGTLSPLEISAAFSAPRGPTGC